MIDLTDHHNSIAELSPHSKLDDGCGVICASDSRYSSFVGLQFIATLLFKKVPLTVFDIGLTKEQIEWLKTKDVNVVYFPINSILPFWQSWNKPFYLRSSPYRYTLWLDTDCLPVGNLKNLFTAIQSQFVVVKHWRDEKTYERPNKPELYEILPVECRFNDKVNAGVLGFDLVRDDLFIRTFCKIVSECEFNAELPKYIGWHDEGCLHWTLQHLKMKDSIVNYRPWNDYVHSYTLTNDSVFPTAQRITNNVKTFVKKMPIKDAVILHYSSNPKPWEHFKME
jgi:hypothetical protein